MGRPIGEWPQLGMIHKNGDRIVGPREYRAEEAHQAGTPPVWGLYKRSVQPAIGEVRIGDLLDVEYDGVKFWWVSQDGVQLGRLTWGSKDNETKGDWITYEIQRPASGKLEVLSLLLSSSGDVVNCGGLVHPS